MEREVLSFVFFGGGGRDVFAFAFGNIVGFSDVFAGVFGEDVCLGDVFVVALVRSMSLEVTLRVSLEGALQGCLWKTSWMFVDGACLVFGADFQVSLRGLSLEGVLRGRISAGVSLRLFRGYLWVFLEGHFCGRLRWRVVCLWGCSWECLCLLLVDILGGVWKLSSCLMGVSEVVLLVVLDDLIGDVFGWEGSLVASVFSVSLRALVKRPGMEVCVGSANNMVNDDFVTLTCFSIWAGFGGLEGFVVLFFVLVVNLLFFIRGPTLSLCTLF